MPIPCSTYSRQSRRCFVSDGSTDCAECVRHGAKSCDIGLSMSQVERLKKIRDDLQRQLKEAEEAKLEVVVRERCLRKQLTLVDSRAKEMFEKEEAILKSLDAQYEAEAERSVVLSAEASSSRVEVPVSDVVGGSVSVSEVPLNSVGASNVSVGGSSFLNDGSPILSPSEHFPESRLSSEEIARFDAFAAEIFPLPGLLDSDVVP